MPTAASLKFTVPTKRHSADDMTARSRVQLVAEAGCRTRTTWQLVVAFWTISMQKMNLFLLLALPSLAHAFAPPAVQRPLASPRLRPQAAIAKVPRSPRPQAAIAKLPRGGGTRRGLRRRL